MSFIVTMKKRNIVRTRYHEITNTSFKYNSFRAVFALNAVKRIDLIVNQDLLNVLLISGQINIYFKCNRFKFKFMYYDISPYLHK